MTSTNDGKEVNSNQTSAPKGKSYYIELYKSLEAGLSEVGTASEHTKQLCEAWRRVHSLCLHSTPSTHPHLLTWLQRHTARTVLQTEWQSSKRKDDRISLEEAINVFIVESRTAAATRTGPTPSWETQLVARGEWFKRILDNPWKHPVLNCLLNPGGTPPTNEEVLKWLTEERGVTFVMRLHTLVTEKCDDIAVSLATAVMERVRADSEQISDLEQAEEPKDKPDNPKRTFGDRLTDEAGFTVDVWEMLTDVEFVLLHKRDSSKCIALAKLTPLRSAYQLIERLQSRLGTSPREKRLWKNSKDVAILIAQVVIARCMVVPRCAGGVRSALYRCARSLARLVSHARLPAAARALAAPAPTAQHLHMLAAAIDAHRAQQKDANMKPFVCELYVRAITAGMNELERLKLKAEKNTEARSMEATLAGWFVQLGNVLGSSARVACECALTAFSLHPSQHMYGRIQAARHNSAQTDAEEQPNTEATNAEFGSWASDSRSQTNFVKTSETLNMKAKQKQGHVLSTAILNDGEALGLSAELCQDIAVLLSGPRVKTLSWDMDRELLLENCRAYMERTNGGTKALTTELKFLNLDPSKFLHLPEEDDDENNIYYGIEKGYEHLVEFPEPEDIWQDAIIDNEKTDTASSSEEYLRTTTTQQRKKKTKRIVMNSDDEEDPLSLVAEIKRIEKTERTLSKERSKKKSVKDAIDDKDKHVEEKKLPEKKEPKRKEKVPKPQGGPLSKLLGLRVAKKKKAPKPLQAVLVNDYDSQGKSSLQYFNSEVNKSRHNSQSSDNVGLVREHDFSKASGMGIIPTKAHFNGPFRPPVVSSAQMQSPPDHSRNASPTFVSEEVKTSITKLLEFRRQKSLNLERKTPNTIRRPEVPDKEVISPKAVVIPEIPKSYINKQNDRLTELQQQVNDILLHRSNAATTQPSPFIQYATPNKQNLIAPSPYINDQRPSMSDHFMKSVNMVPICDKNEPHYSESRPFYDLPHDKPKCNQGVNYHDFLHEYHNSFNTFNVADRQEQKKVIRPVSKVTPVLPHMIKSEKSPQSAKQIQQKKPDGSLNTFSRLSYYKNKQTDMRNKSCAPSPTSSKTVGSKLEGFILNHLHQSSQDKSQNSFSETQKAIEECDSPKVRDHPTLSNILQGSSPQKPVSPPKNTLSEKDQHDLILLLRQQNLLNKPVTLSTRTAYPIESQNPPSNPPSNMKETETKDIAEGKMMNVVSNTVVSLEDSAMTRHPKQKSTNLKKPRDSQLKISQSKKTERHNDHPKKSAAKPEPKDSKEWQNVMNALAKHKTPSRGPNALDMALNKSSFEKAFEDSLRKPSSFFTTTKTSSTESIKSSETDYQCRGVNITKSTSRSSINPVIPITETKTPNTVNKTPHIPKPKPSNSKNVSSKNSLNAMIENVVKQNNVEIVKNDTKANHTNKTLDTSDKSVKLSNIGKRTQRVSKRDLKQMFDTCTMVHQEKHPKQYTNAVKLDPYTLGIPNSDYDLLEELMDDDLRKEIGELSSDDESYSTAARSFLKDSNNVEKRVNVVLNDGLDATTPKEKSMNSSAQIICENDILHSYAQKTTETLLKSILPIPKPIRDETSVREVNELNVQNVSTHITTSQAYNSANMLQNTQISIEPNVFITALPQTAPLQNVVLIGSDLVYEGYASVPTPIQNATHIASNTYMAVESVPNMNVYHHTTQFTSIVSPVIFASTVTVPIMANNLCTTTPMQSNNITSVTQSTYSYASTEVNYSSLNVDLSRNNTFVNSNRDLEDSNITSPIQNDNDANFNKYGERKVVIEVHDKNADEESYCKKRGSNGKELKNQVDQERVRRKRLAILNREINQICGNGMVIALEYSPLHPVKKIDNERHKDIKNAIDVNVVPSINKTIQEPEVKSSATSKSCKNYKKNENEIISCRRILLRSSNKLKCASSIISPPLVKKTVSRRPPNKSTENDKDDTDKNKTKRVSKRIRNKLTTTAIVNNKDDIIMPINKLTLINNSTTNNENKISKQSEKIAPNQDINTDKLFNIKAELLDSTNISVINARSPWNISKTDQIVDLRRCSVIKEEQEIISAPIQKPLSRQAKDLPITIKNVSTKSAERLNLFKDANTAVIPSNNSEEQMEVAVKMRNNREEPIEVSLKSSDVNSVPVDDIPRTVNVNEEIGKRIIDNNEVTLSSDNGPKCSNEDIKQKNDDTGNITNYQNTCLAEGPNALITSEQSTQTNVDLVRLSDILMDTEFVRRKKDQDVHEKYLMEIINKDALVTEPIITNALKIDKVKISNDVPKLSPTITVEKGILREVDILEVNLLTGLPAETEKGGKITDDERNPKAIKKSSNTKETKQALEEKSSSVISRMKASNKHFGCYKTSFMNEKNKETQNIAEVDNDVAVVDVVQKPIEKHLVKSTEKSVTVIKHNSTKPTTAYIESVLSASHIKKVNSDLPSKTLILQKSIKGHAYFKTSHSEKITKSQSQLQKQVTDTNMVTINNTFNTNLSNESALHSLKNSITIEQLPSKPGDDPLKKTVRIKHVNGKVFRGTVRGPINVDAILKDPKLHSLLLNQFEQSKKRYTLKVNVNQVVTKSASGQVLTTYLQPITKPDTPIETVNLLSDDEEETVSPPIQTFETEYGKYKTQSMDNDLFSKHQNKLKLKSYVPLIKISQRRENTKKTRSSYRCRKKAGENKTDVINVENPVTQILCSEILHDVKISPAISKNYVEDSVSDIANNLTPKHKMPETDSNVVLIDDSSNDSVEQNKKPKEKIYELKNMLLRDLGVVNKVKKIVQPTSKVPDDAIDLTDDTVVMQPANKKDLINNDYVKIMNRKCFVKLVRCDYIVTNSKSLKDLQTEDAIKESEEINDMMPKPLSRSGSFSLLEDFPILDEIHIKEMSTPESELKLCSPVMEVHDIIAALEGKLLTNHNASEPFVASSKCDAEWMTTKMAYTHLNVTLTEYQRNVKIYENECVLTNAKFCHTFDVLVPMNCDAEWLYCKHLAHELRLKQADTCNNSYNYEPLTPKKFIENKSQTKNSCHTLDVPKLSTMALQYIQKEDSLSLLYGYSKYNVPYGTAILSPNFLKRKLLSVASPVAKITRLNYEHNEPQGFSSFSEDRALYLASQKVLVNSNNLKFNYPNNKPGNDSLDIDLDYQDIVMGKVTISNNNEDNKMLSDKTETAFEIKKIENVDASVNKLLEENGTANVHTTAEINDKTSESTCKISLPVNNITGREQTICNKELDRNVAASESQNLLSGSHPIGEAGTINETSNRTSCELSIETDMNPATIHAIADEDIHLEGNETSAELSCDISTENDFISARITGQQVNNLVNNVVPSEPQNQLTNNDKNSGNDCPVADSDIANSENENHVKDLANQHNTSQSSNPGPTADITEELLETTKEISYHASVDADVVHADVKREQSSVNTNELPNQFPTAAVKKVSNQGSAEINKEIMATTETYNLTTDADKILAFDDAVVTKVQHEEINETLHVISADTDLVPTDIACGNVQCTEDVANKSNKCAIITDKKLIEYGYIDIVENEPNHGGKITEIVVNNKQMAGSKLVTDSEEFNIINESTVLQNNKTVDDKISSGIVDCKEHMCQNRLLDVNLSMNQCDTFITTEYNYKIPKKYTHSKKIAATVIDTDFSSEKNHEQNQNKDQEFKIGENSRVKLDQNSSFGDDHHISGMEESGNSLIQTKKPIFIEVNNEITGNFMDQKHDVNPSEICFGEQKNTYVEDVMISTECMKVEHGYASSNNATSHNATTMTEGRNHDSINVAFSEGLSQTEDSEIIEVSIVNMSNDEILDDELTITNLTSDIRDDKNLKNSCNNDIDKQDISNKLATEHTFNSGIKQYYQDSKDTESELITTKQNIDMSRSHSIKLDDKKDYLPDVNENETKTDTNFTNICKGLEQNITLDKVHVKQLNREYKINTPSSSASELNKTSDITTICHKKFRNVGEMTEIGLKQNYNVPEPCVKKCDQNLKVDNVFENNLTKSEALRNDVNDSEISTISYCFGQNINGNFLESSVKEVTEVEIKGMEYEDPDIGTCFVFPIIEDVSELLDDDSQIDESEEVDEIIQKEKSFHENFSQSDENEVYDAVNQKKEGEVIKDLSVLSNEPDIPLIVPKQTYASHLMIQKSLKNMKRKKDMSDFKFIPRKYRKGKNIDYPKITATAMNETVYAKEYKRIIDYCSTVKFSYSIPFHIECIDVGDMLNAWPIQDGHELEENDSDHVEDVLYTDIENGEPVRVIVDPLNQTLSDEIMNGNTVNSYKPIDINETNFSKGFGEWSGRVIKELENGNTKSSAATLSDVKPNQPFSMSEDRNASHEINEQNIKMHYFMNCFSLKEKVQSFFKNTAFKISYDLQKGKKYEQSLSNDSDLSNFPFGLTNMDFFMAPSTQTLVNIVQVGQLPVSANAQNPVTCDPRVTQVSDASPSQCSDENSPGEDSQATIETEYTELTTANITLPLQEYVQHHQSPAFQDLISSQTDDTANDSTMSIVKIELMEENSQELNQDNDVIYENDFSPLPNNNVEYSFDDTSNTIFNHSNNVDNTNMGNRTNDMFHTSTNMDNSFTNVFNATPTDNTFTDLNTNTVNASNNIEDTASGMDKTTNTFCSTNVYNTNKEVTSENSNITSNLENTSDNSDAVVNLENSFTTLFHQSNGMEKENTPVETTDTSNINRTINLVNRSNDINIQNTNYDYSYENMQNYTDIENNNTNIDNYPSNVDSYSTNVQSYESNENNFANVENYGGDTKFATDDENYASNINYRNESTNYAPNLETFTPNVENNPSNIDHNNTNIDDASSNILEQSQPQDLSLANSPPVPNLRKLSTEKNQDKATSEKRDQIAHAMNAAGITSESSDNDELTNLINESAQPESFNTPVTANTHYSKTAIGVMTLQQALAQVLPPPLNQTGSFENNQIPNNPVTQQVLHIVQGNNAPTVINKPNGTHLLHIVQNKNVPTANGLSLVEGGLQQGNQLIHIVNNGKQNSTGQFLKRVNLLTNVANAQGSNEQKMIQFVCKSADGKSIQLNTGHQRSMVLRLHPTSVQTVPKPTEPQDLSAPTTSAANPTTSQEPSEPDLKLRSVYDENYVRFVQNKSPPSHEKSTSLPKFNQVFGKQPYSENQNEINPNGSEHSDSQTDENNGHIEQTPEASSPSLLVRNPPPPETTQASHTPVQQMKKTISPFQTMHGGVIYTRQIPVNLGGQTINLITVPSTELVDEPGQKQQADVNFGNQEGNQPSIIKLVPHPHAANSTNLTTEENNAPAVSSNDTSQIPQTQPVLTQMRIKLPMLSKGPHIVPGTRLIRPSIFQIQRNVIAGTNQPVYQQLVLTAAPSLAQPIRLPTRQAQQAQSPQQAQQSPLVQVAQPAQQTRHVHQAQQSQSHAQQSQQVQPNQHSKPDSELSTLTMEQLREFDMVLEQVKERSIVQPPLFPTCMKPIPYEPKTSADSTDSSATTTSVSESTQQVLYSVDNNHPANVVSYVNRKSTITSATTSYVRSPDSSGIVETPSSSTQVQITHTVTSKSTTADHRPNPPKKKKKKKKSSSSSSALAALNNSPSKASTLKPQEDEQTTQRILYILAEYKEQVENSPDKNKPAPRRRNQFPPTTGSKRKRSHCSSRASCPHGEMSPDQGDPGENGDDSLITLGSEDSSCGTTFSECTECQESHSPEDSPHKVVRRLTFEQETTTQITQTRTLPQRNVIVGDGQTITVARTTTTAKPTTTVLMPANYLLPVSMIKGGQQIAIMTNRGPKLLVGAGDANAGALLFQRLIGPGLKPVLARPGVRHIRLPTTALHNLHTFNIQTTPVSQVQPPDSTAPQPQTPAPPDLVDTRAMSSPWQDRDAQDKPEREPSPDCTEPWSMPSSSIAEDYGYEEIVRTDNMERTVLVVQQRKDGRHHRVTHVSTAALRHKYAILEHELRLQKSLSEECEDLGVDSPSASDLFPEADILFGAPSPAHEQTIDECNTPPPIPLTPAPHPDLDDQIATDQLLTPNVNRHEDLDLNLDDVGEIVTVGEDGVATIPTINPEEFARSHPNTTFHTEPEDGEIPPFTIAHGIKGRHITFHANRVPGTVVMAPQTTVISQASVNTNDAHNTVKFTDIDNMINSMPGPPHANGSSVVKDPTPKPLSKFDSLLQASLEPHLAMNTPTIVHSAGQTTQVIRRLRYDERTQKRFLADEPRPSRSISDEVKLRNDRAMVESMGDNASSPGQPELFWDTTPTVRNERKFQFNESEKVTKSPFDELLNDSSAYGPHTRLDSVIKAARPERTFQRTSFEGISMSGSSDDSRPLRTYPPKRVPPPTQNMEKHFTKTMHHDLERNMKTSHHHELKKTLPRCQDEGRRRASGRGVVKRGCSCCNGSTTAPPKKKSRPKKPPPDFSNS